MPIRHQTPKTPPSTKSPKAQPQRKTQTQTQQKRAHASMRNAHTSPHSFLDCADQQQDARAWSCEREACYCIETGSQPLAKGCSFLWVGGKKRESQRGDNPATAPSLSHHPTTFISRAREPTIFCRIYMFFSRSTKWSKRSYRSSSILHRVGIGSISPRSAQLIWTS